mgnify:CR=1 FL=1
MIGVFDSGLGGLSVWREIVQVLPQEAIWYYADSAYCPYGNRPEEEVIAYSHRITQYLLKKGCQLIVVACNTATGLAIDILRDTYEIPFVGMEPDIKPAAQHTHSGTIGVLATGNTLQGAHFLQAKSRLEQEIDILTTDAKGLVGLVEQGLLEGEATTSLLKSYIEPMLEKGADHLVLGCSHYPFLMGPIQEIIQGKAIAVDPAPAVARQTQLLFQQHAIQSGSSTPTEYHFVTSAKVHMLKAFVQQVASQEVVFKSRFWKDPTA